MATKTVLVDDLDGGDAQHSVMFSVDDAFYEIDLSEANAERLKECLEPFISAGRRVMVRKTVTPKAKGRRVTATVSEATSAEMNRAIRDWARRQGHEISDRGRIPETIMEEFNQAHKGKSAATNSLFSHSGRE